jgi:hypothetical protein
VRYTLSQNLKPKDKESDDAKCSEYGDQDPCEDNGILAWIIVGQEFSVM